jgi:ribokinase
LTVFDVVGFGALNVDKLYRVNRIACAEEESFIQNMTETCGGSAANTIVGLARLGCTVGFVGKISADREGELQLAEFKKENVDINGIVKAKQGCSGLVTGFVDKQGQRALYINSGINDTLLLGDVNLSYISQTKFLHLTSFVGEKSYLTQKSLIKKIPQSVKVSFDPGAIYARKGLAELEPIIKRCYVIMPNRGELQLMVGFADYVKGADSLIERGVKVVAVKLGEEGSYVTNGRERHHIEAFKTKTLDTTGAGDAFCAGFLYGLLRNRGLRECGLIGNFVASRKITKAGARAGLPRAADLGFLKQVFK